MAKTKQTTETNKPVHVLRLRGVKVAVFENQSAEGSVFHKIALQRVYRDGEEWKTTQSLNRDDIPIATLLLQSAWEWVLEREASAVREESSE